ncbi:peptide deformylase [Terasakiella sp. A23]|uniref:peptide deformylase n=1 Tax=Terasakiella sp. FCG-A23 TaxID=3080561 RepID=UPI002955A5FD|nr:peptide deformylase [Terasakiella sp. A23]MDV7337955.1 peptide deformylase [Terasakiella sp. A23]
MAILKILTAPDPVLKKKAQPVEEVTDDIRTLLDDMVETMYDAPGIGLAAPQVGVLKTVIVIDVTKDEDEPFVYKMVNPEIVWSSDELGTYEEGCLSVPESYSEVERPERVKVRYLDENGQSMEVECDGLLATCVQHEIDHLNGKLFIDHISRIKRSMIMRRLTKLKKSA